MELVGPALADATIVEHYGRKLKLAYAFYEP
jgi:hypothetical protein